MYEIYMFLDFFLLMGKALLLIVVLLLITAYVLLADRKIWAAVQLRRGPNVVGPFGLLQSFADFIKFLFKEPIIPDGADRFLFLLAPFLMAFFALIAWAVIPLGNGFVLSDINVGVLYVMATSSLGVYTVIIGGWASNSKYPFLSSMRSAAQMISYEVSIGFVLLSVLLVAGSLNLSQIVMAQKHLWFIFPQFPMFLIFFISALAETNRPPFDLAEAESELVAGFMTEYSSTPYLLFMLGEYINVILMCAMVTVLFLGGWLSPFSVAPFIWIPGIVWFILKTLLVFFFFALIKAIVPRYRYDQLMRLGWKIFLPISIVWLFITALTLQLMQNGIRM